jgi:hypothetical protein
MSEGGPAEIPEEISNELILDKKENLISLKEPKFRGWLDRNLLDNLKEDLDYVIVNEEVWSYLHTMFGGIEIKRYGTIIDSETLECIVEVNL